MKKLFFLLLFLCLCSFANAKDIGTTRVMGDLTVANYTYIGADVVIRDNGGGDVEVSEDSGATWTDIALGGGIGNVVEDTTPQLGGFLDANGKYIMDATDAVDIMDDLSASQSLTATALFIGTVTNTEFSYLDGVTSDIQTQLNAKQATLTTYSEAGDYGFVSDNLSVANNLSVGNKLVVKC